MGRSPQTFNDFIGQRRAVRYVERLIKGAKHRGVPCPHLLLVGRSGAGKTSLARALAQEYGSTFHTLFAGEDTRPVDLCVELASLRYGDIFFIDEAHSLTRDAQQLLYLALDERKIPALKEGRLDRAHHESIADFTLVLATNEPGRLKLALRGRLTSVEFAAYTPRELVAIARRVAEEQGVEVTSQAARRLAEASQGSPRRVGQLLGVLPLFWPPPVRRFTQQHVEHLLRHKGVDGLGLTPNQRRYLRVLAASLRGTCPLSGLATRLGCDVAYVKEEVELYLLDQGWVAIASGSGRKITPAGKGIVAGKGTESCDAPKEVTP